MAKRQPRKSDPDLLGRLFRDMVLSWRLLFDGRVGGMVKMIPLAMLGYIISPIDLIPEIFLPFGIVDDIGALIVGLQLFIHNAPPDVVQEYREGKKDEPDDRRFGKRKPPQIIEGDYEVREDDARRDI